MAGELVTTAEAAARLGVKRETLYAYVSRGLLRRHRSEDGRSSRFDALELDRLARQRGTRRGPAPRVGMQELVVASAVSTIAEGRIRFRGIDVSDLVGKQTFESVAQLLWTGQLPDSAPVWSAPAVTQQVVSSVAARLPPTASPADRMRVGLAAAASADPLRVDVRAEAVLVTAPVVLVALADALGQPGDGARDLPLAQRATRALAADPRWQEAIDAVLVVLADHELASSTLAARIAASTRADPYQVVLAGLAAVSGPLHGSASGQVQRLLSEAAGPEGPEVALAAWLRHSERAPGFGHPLYSDGDPRARLLLPIVRVAAGEDLPGMDVVDGVLSAMARRAPVAPNVDFALGALTFLAGLPPTSGEALFALARSAGWLAHAMEEYQEPPLRFRVRAEPLEPRSVDAELSTRSDSATSGV